MGEAVAAGLLVLAVGLVLLRVRLRLRPRPVVEVNPALLQARLRSAEVARNAAKRMDEAVQRLRNCTCGGGAGRRSGCGVGGGGPWVESWQ